MRLFSWLAIKDILEGGGGGSPNLQSKEVTITENGETTISPDTGYDGLSEVDLTVNVPTGGSVTVKSTTATSNSKVNKLVFSVDAEPMFFCFIFTPSASSTESDTSRYAMGGIWKHGDSYVRQTQARNYNNQLVREGTSGDITYADGKVTVTTTWYFKGSYTAYYGY